MAATDVAGARTAQSDSTRSTGSATTPAGGTDHPSAAANASDAASTDSMPAPAVRYIDLAKLDGYQLPIGEPWSPHDLRVLLVRRGRLYVFDAARPKEAPREILESQVLNACWSPDGSYVCCRVRVPTAMRGGAVRLQFVEAIGGPSEYRIPRARIGPYFWAEDGSIYFWDSQNGTRYEMQPPLSWRDKHIQLPAARRTHLLEVPESGKRRPRIIAFTVRVDAREPREETVAALMPPVATNVSVADEFPRAAGDSSRFLVHLQPQNSSLRTYVVNAAGDHLARIGEATGLPAFKGTSVSPDGRYVLGHRANEGAGTLLGSALWLADGGGRWCGRIAGAGNAVASRFSHQDLTIVYETADGDAVHVGRLEVAP